MARLGTFDIVELLEETGSSRHLLVTATDGSEVVAKEYVSSPLIDAAEDGRRRRAFLAGARVQQSLGKTDHWVEIIQIEGSETAGGSTPFFITPRLAGSLRLYTDSGNRLGHDLLKAVAQGVLEGLDELQKVAGGRGFGQLTPGNILFAKTRDASSADIFLTDLPASAGADQREDLQALGMLLARLATGEEAPALSSRGKVDAAWMGLEPHALAWQNFCRLLTAESNGLSTPQAALAALKPIGAATAKSIALKAAIAAGLIVVVAGGGWFGYQKMGERKSDQRLAEMHKVLDKIGGDELTAGISPNDKTKKPGWQRWRFPAKLETAAAKLEAIGLSKVSAEFSREAELLRNAAGSDISANGFDQKVQQDLQAIKAVEQLLAIVPSILSKHGLSEAEFKAKFPEFEKLHSPQRAGPLHDMILDYARKLGEWRDVGLDDSQGPALAKLQSTLADQLDIVQKNSLTVDGTIVSDAAQALARIKARPAFNGTTAGAQADAKLVTAGEKAETDLGTAIRSGRMKQQNQNLDSLRAIVLSCTAPKQIQHPALTKAFTAFLEGRADRVKDKATADKEINEVERIVKSIDALSSLSPTTAGKDNLAAWGGKDFASAVEKSWNDKLAAAAQTILATGSLPPGNTLQADSQSFQRSFDEMRTFWKDLPNHARGDAEVSQKVNRYKDTEPFKSAGPVKFLAAVQVATAAGLLDLVKSPTTTAGERQFLHNSVLHEIKQGAFPKAIDDYKALADAYSKASLPLPVDDLWQNHLRLFAADPAKCVEGALPVRQILYADPRWAPNQQEQALAEKFAQTKIRIELQRQGVTFAAIKKSLTELFAVIPPSADELLKSAETPDPVLQAQPNPAPSPPPPNPSPQLTSWPDGWTASEITTDSVLLTSTKASANSAPLQLRFRKVSNTFVATSEAPVRLFRHLNAAQTAALVLTRKMPAQPPAGLVRTYRLNESRNNFRVAGNAETGIEKDNDAAWGGSANRDLRPIHYLNAESADDLARAQGTGMRLPTLAEYLEARKDPTADAANANLRDQAFASWKLLPGMSSLADYMVGNSIQKGDPAAVAQNNDGIALLRATQPTATSFADLDGNVAEFVKTDGGFAVVGRSAFSDPTASADTPISVPSTNLRPDCGFRLAFDVPGSLPSTAQVPPSPPPPASAVTNKPREPLEKLKDLLAKLP